MSKELKELFLDEIAENIRNTVKKKKAAGITGMSLVNLQMVTPTPKNNKYPVAPEGYSELIRQIASKVCPDFLI